MMDSRAGDSRIGANYRTFGDTTLSDSELDSDSTIYSEATPTMNRSIESSVNASLVTARYDNDRKLTDDSDICSYKTWRSKISKSSKTNSLNDSKSSSILAGNVGISSRDSSDSYHSAQSTLMSTEEATTNLNIALTESKQRDTNFNFDSSTESEASASTLNSTNEETSHFMLPFLERLSKELNIHPQENQEKRAQLKRLSGHFAQNPEDFKNKLVTIIEESEMTNQQSQAEKTCDKSHRMSEQLRKICKYIMDESMPVGIMISPTAPLNDQTATNSFRQNPGEIGETPKIQEKPEIIDLCTPPNRQLKKVYRKTPKYVYTQRSTQSPLCVATLKKNNETPGANKMTPKTPGSIKMTPKTPGSIKMTPGTPETIKMSPKTLIDKFSPRTPLDKSELIDSFTYWERLCDKHATPVSESKKKRRSCSVPDIIYLIESNEIKRNADIQLRALETSDDESFVGQRKKRTFSRYESFENVESSSDEESMLEKSVLEEVALKRQLCYESERISLNSSDDDDDHDEYVMKYMSSVIDRCGEYQQCLVKNRTTLHKTLENIARESPKKTLQPKGSSNPGSVNSKNSKSPGVPSGSSVSSRKPPLNRSKSCLSFASKVSGRNLQVPLVSSTAATPIKATPSKSESNPLKISERKPKFFATPGSTCRTPLPRSKPSKYFDSPQIAEKTSNNLKPKKAFTGLEYFGYSTVKSPVAQYIRSTDSKLVQNVKGKIEETLLTPRNGKNKPSSAAEALRMPLSRQNQQNQRKEENNENIPVNSAAKSFPKVIYRPASRVRDIRLSPSKKYGERERILREANNRMIIQHASRFNDGEAEESIQVSKQAAKTNCLGAASSTTTSRKPWK